MMVRENVRAGSPKSLEFILCALWVFALPFSPLTPQRKKERQEKFQIKIHMVAVEEKTGIT